MDCTDPNVPTSLACIPVFIGNITSALVPLAGVAALILIIFSGIRFLTSGGDPLKVEGAKKTLTFAIIGFVIVLMAFVIIKIFSRVSGVECNIIGVNC